MLPYISLTQILLVSFEFYSFVVVCVIVQQYPVISLHNKFQIILIIFSLYLGQILNRFSRDIFLMDEELPLVFCDFVTVRLSLLLLLFISTIFIIDITFFGLITDSTIYIDYRIIETEFKV